MLGCHQAGGLSSSAFVASGGIRPRVPEVCVPVRAPQGPYPRKEHQR